MGAIDWTYLGSVGGDGIEDFVATCLRQKYPDAEQTNPAQGDGGVDIYRSEADGMTVWQIKKFTAPLTSSQKSQIKKSWKRFWDSHVATGTPIKQYYLATPWPPTEGYREWFDKLTKDAEFPTQWDGRAFFDGLAAEYPATAARFFEGPDMLENMVNTKAILASTAPEAADQVSMVEALRRRDEALNDIRDLVSDNYFIDTGTRSSLDGGWPLPGPNEAGLVYRYTHRGGNRYDVESLVPKNVQSTEIDPISIEVSFLVEPGTPAAQQVEEWRLWGVPLRDVEAETRQKGGPFGESEPHRGLVSILARPDGRRHPDLRLAVVSPERSEKASMTLATTEATKGITGDGTRVVAASAGGVIRFELRTGSSEAPDSIRLNLSPVAGLDPRSVREDLQCLAHGEDSDTITVSVNGHPLAAAGDIGAAVVARTVTQIAEDLADLQPHAAAPLVMPALGETTMSQVEKLHWLADIYRGNAVETTWERIAFTVTDPEGLRDKARAFNNGSLVQVEKKPTFYLGSSECELTRWLAHQFVSAAVAPHTDFGALQAGDQIELVPGDTDRLVIAAVNDA